jgi:hypothetical protein
MLALVVIAIVTTLLGRALRIHRTALPDDE